MNKTIDKNKVESIIKKDKRMLRFVDVIYHGNGKKVRYENLNHINWANVRAITLEFAEGQVKWIGDEFVNCNRKKVK